MKKFTLLFLMLPNLFFANDLSSDEDFEFKVVKNTKALLLNSLTAKADLSIELFQLIGNSKYKVNARFNRRLRILDLNYVTPGTYVVTARLNNLYTDYLINVTDNKVVIVDEKTIQNPIFNHINKKMSINLDSNKTEVLVKIENYNGELIFYENFSTEELQKKVFNLKENYGRIITTVEYDNKTFVNKFVL